MGVAIAAGCALTIGWFAGVLTFRIKQRWCPACGTSLACPHGHRPPWQPRTSTQERNRRDDTHGHRGHECPNVAPAAAWRTATRSGRAPDGGAGHGEVVDG